MIKYSHTKTFTFFATLITFLLIFEILINMQKSYYKNEVILVDAVTKFEKKLQKVIDNILSYNKLDDFTVLNSLNNKISKYTSGNLYILQYQTYNRDVSVLWENIREKNLILNPTQLELHDNKTYVTIYREDRIKKIAIVSPLTSISSNSTIFFILYECNLNQLFNEIFNPTMHEIDISTVSDAYQSIDFIKYKPRLAGVINQITVLIKNREIKAINQSLVPVILIIFFICGIYYSYRQDKIIDDYNHKIQTPSEDKIMLYRGRMLTSLEREIKDPIQAISIFSAVLKRNLIRSNIDEKLYGMLHSINSNSVRLMHIFNDVTELADITTNNIALKPTIVNLPKFSMDLEKMYSPRSREKGLNFTMLKSYPVPREIHVDLLRLKQLLFNLLNNAVKFTEHGFITVMINYNLNKHMLSFEISDSGPGIEKHILEKLIRNNQDMFNDDIEIRGGGMTVCINLCRQMGGELQAHSSPGVGSSFIASVYAPLVESTGLIKSSFADQQAQNAFEENLVTENNDAERFAGKVLIAENWYENELLMEWYVVRFGLDADFVQSGPQAIEAYKRDKYDLIFLDIHLSEISGVEVLQQLRAIGCKIPIIALATSKNISDNYFINVGFDQCLIKPLELKYFAKVLSTYLSKANGRFIPIDEVYKDENMRAVFIKYIDDLNHTKLELDNLLEFQDYDALKNMVHSMKQVSGSFGLKSLMELSSRIESEIDNNLLEQVKIDTPKLSNLIVDIIHDTKNNPDFSKYFN